MRARGSRGARASSHGESQRAVNIGAVVLEHRKGTAVSTACPRGRRHHGPPFPREPPHATYNEASVTVRGGERDKLGPGDYFGEIALIDEGARSATVTADSELRCYGLTSWEFRPLVEGNAGIAWKLLETMAKRLRAAQS